jgi:hypothetical protein
VGDDEELVGLCEGRFVGLQAAFSLGGGGSMLAKDLNSYTEATLMAFVKGEEAPSGLVPSWLDETGLRRRLRDYQSPTLAKKVKSEGSNSLVLEPLDTGEESQGEQHFSFQELRLTSFCSAPASGPRAAGVPSRRDTLRCGQG